MSPFFFDSEELTGKKTIKSKSFLADPCKLCGLFKGCISPKMKSYGQNKKQVFVLGEAPGVEEDEFVDKKTGEKGRGFVGKSGKLASNILKENGIDFDLDCVRSNVLQCHSPKNEFNPEKVQYCYDRLEKQIVESKPKLILCFGLEAVERILETDVIPDTMGNLHSFVFPSIKYHSWVACHYHPAFALRFPEFGSIIYRDIENSLKYLDIELPEALLDSGENLVFDGREAAIEFLDSITGVDYEVSFDIETTRLSPFYDDSELLSVAFCFSDNNVVYGNKEFGYVIPLKPVDEGVWKAFQKFLESTTPKICHAGKFEELWCRQFFGYICNRYWDTQLTAHVLDEHPDTKSLASQAFLATGEEYKGMVDRTKMGLVDKNTLYKYNSLDSRFTFLIYKNQMKQIIKEGLENPNKFLLRGDRALAELEWNGIKIDREAFYDYKENIVEKGYKEAIQTLKTSNYAEIFRNKKGREIDIDKPDDLKFVLFQLADLKPISLTSKKREPQLNDELFQFYKNDPEAGEFCKSIIEYRTVNKMKTTYIQSIEKYVDKNWFLHPTYNLWTTVTYRSSCDSPNLQNVPKRDEAQAEFRKIFIPRYDLLLDADHKGSEVVIQAMLANDKVLIEQLKSGFDPHQYWASLLYQKDEKDITSKERYQGKNGFVFPLLYGSYYVTIARNMDLVEGHVKLCEEKFFEMYTGIEQYQTEKVREYNRFGYVTTPLGFRRHAPLSRNQIVNFPIQSVSFHYLLDTLSMLVLEILKEYKFKSLPVLQVHDSILSDMVENEMDDYIAILNELTENKPYFNFVKNLSISVEYSTGENWLEMEELK